MFLKSSALDLVISEIAANTTVPRLPPGPTPNLVLKIFFSFSLIVVGSMRGIRKKANTGIVIEWNIWDMNTKPAFSWRYRKYGIGKYGKGTHKRKHASLTKDSIIEFLQN